METNKDFLYIVEGDKDILLGQILNKTTENTILGPKNYRMTVSIVGSDCINKTRTTFKHGRICEFNFCFGVIIEMATSFCSTTQAEEIIFLKIQGVGK